MKAIFNTRRKLLLLVAACQLHTTFCTTRLYTEPLFSNIRGQPEKNMLQSFIAAGIEKSFGFIRQAHLKIDAVAALWTHLKSLIRKPFQLFIKGRLATA